MHTTCAMLSEARVTHFHTTVSITGTDMYIIPITTTCPANIISLSQQHETHLQNSEALKPPAQLH